MVYPGKYLLFAESIFLQISKASRIFKKRWSEKWYKYFNLELKYRNFNFCTYEVLIWDHRYYVGILLQISLIFVIPFCNKSVRRPPMERSMMVRREIDGNVQVVSMQMEWAGRADGTTTPAALFISDKWLVSCSVSVRNASCFSFRPFQYPMV